MKTNNNYLPFVTVKQAKKLKELGFDWPASHFYVIKQEEPKQVFACWDMNPQQFSIRPVNWNLWKCGGEFCNLSAPTIEHALMWMRKVKGVECSVNVESPHTEYRGVIIDSEKNLSWFPTYEEAELDLLTECIKQLEENELVY